MKTVIEKYKVFIFIFTAINLFALLVNVFGVEGFNVTGTYGETPFSKIYYFTHETMYGGNAGLWPFVTFIETTQEGNQRLYDFTIFHGIFYQYGVAEFLLYMGILIGFLVYKAYISKPSATIVKTPL